MKKLILRLLYALHILSRPLVILWFSMFESRRVRVAVWCEEELLLVQTSFGPQRFSLPGGGIEKGESAVQAALRELREETGLRLTEDDLKLVGEMHTRSPAIPFHMTVFETKVADRTLPALSKLRSLEITDRRWVSRTLLPHSNQVIEWYLKQR